MNKLSREQLIEMVEVISQGRGIQEEIDQLLKELENSVPHPAVSDLIFFADPELTPEEVVDTALAYQPVVGVWTD